MSHWLQERKFFVRSAINDSIVTFNGENFFDVKAIANVTMLIAPEEFSCELDIPEANYTARKEAIYYPGEYYLSFIANTGWLRSTYMVQALWRVFRSTNRGRYMLLL